MVSKIRNKFRIKYRGFNLVEAILGIFLVTLSIVGFFSAITYGKQYMKEAGYRRIARVMAEGEMEYVLWEMEQGREPSDEVVTEFKMFGEDVENLEVEMTRDFNGPHEEKTTNIVGGYSIYYNFIVTVRWGYEGEKQKEFRELTITKRIYD